MKKTDHAAILFREMSKFREVGLLCDIVVPGKIKVESAHRIVLLSAKSCDGETSSDEEQFSTSSEDSVEAAYLPLEKTSNNAKHKSVNSSLQQRLGNLNELRLHNCCCDVTLKTETSQHDAHRVVLAACSDYFRAMFTLNMKENRMNSIELKGIDSHYFQKVLEFIYTGEILLNPSESMEIMHIAVYYQIHELVYSCKAYLLSQISTTNCCSLYQLGKDLGLESFAKTCFKFVHDHFSDLTPSDCDVGLLDEEALLRCLKSNLLGGGTPNSKSEQKIFQVVLNWLNVHAFDISPNFVDEILTNLRFALIQFETLELCFDELKKIFRDAKLDQCYKDVIASHITSAAHYHSHVYEQPFLQTRHTKLRTEVQKLACVDGVLTQSDLQLPTDFPEQLDGDVFVNETDSTVRDPFHSVVVLNGFVFVLGGTRYYRNGYSSSVLRYDPRLNRWTELSDMLHERADFVACVVGENIYVVGGRNRFGAISRCEKYDCRLNEWTPIMNLPQGIYMASGVSLNGCIYVAGGFNDCEALGSMMKYSTITNSWEEMVSPMMVDRGYHVMIQGPDEKLWVVGGVDNPFAGRNVWEIEAFDTTSNNWLFLGQVLPVQPFLSTLRLNMCKNDRNHICVFSVSKPLAYPSVAYDDTERMWYQMRNYADFPNIAIDGSVIK